jgi:hypothetical protein
MPCVGFESMISASEGAKTVHALDRSATVTGFKNTQPLRINYSTATERVTSLRIFTNQGIIWYVQLI